MRHRAAVDLHERAEPTVLLVDEQDRRVGRERPLAHPILERLTRFALSLIPKSLKPGDPRGRVDVDVQLGERGGVR
jgi:hypothetical protein